MKPHSLREALEDKLTPKEKEKLITSFDIIGTVAIIDIPDELKKKEKIIGEALLLVHQSVKTVCKRADIHRGKFRVRPLKVIAGKPAIPPGIAGSKKTETIYKESGAVMKLDPAKVYFTPRLSHERERIACQVKPNEKIGAFFAGVGPFPLVIFKKQPKAKLWAIELNPVAVRYLKENIIKNNALNNIFPYLGDVNKVAPGLGVKFNRILMPLPKGAADFLDASFKCAAKGCIIHFYQFSRTEDPFAEAIEKIRENAKKNGRKVKIMNKHIVRPYAPHVVQVVIDAKVL